jgi:hypothetical protein
MTKVFLVPIPHPNTGVDSYYTYDVFLGDEKIVSSSKDPICQAARVLAKKGVKGRVEVWDRERPYPRLSFRPGALKGWRFSEARRGWGYKKWEPFSAAGI